MEIRLLLLALTCTASVQAFVRVQIFSSAGEVGPAQAHRQGFCQIPCSSPSYSSSRHRRRCRPVYNDFNAEKGDTEQRETTHEADSSVDVGDDDDEDDMPKPQNWRRFRAKLIAGSEEAWQAKLARNVNPQLVGVEAWAHELKIPETGCVLLANPRQFTKSQQYFHQVSGKATRLAHVTRTDFGSDWQPCGGTSM